MNDFWHYTLLKYYDISITPVKIVGMLILLLGTRLLILLLKQGLLKKISSDRVEEGIRTSLYQLIKYVVWIIVGALCISWTGVKLTWLLASSAALLVGIGFGLQNVFVDFISGFIMLFDHSLKVGDIIEVDKVAGKVLAIKLRTTVIQTREDYNIIIPNHKFITENLINWSHESFDRRFEITVGVSYYSNIPIV